MKVILINTSFKDIFGYERMFPIGLGYIAAVLLQNGYEVKLLEPQLDNISDNELKNFLSEENPDIVGITAVTPTFPEAVRIAKIIKEGTAAKTALGGVHASCLPEQIILRYPEFDFVVAGEGEYAMLELCNELKKDRPNFYGISGLYFRKNAAPVKNKPRDYITDLDAIPMPARDLVNLNKYRLPLHIDKGKRSASMITSRGCPAKCTFCSSKVTMGNIFRPHSSDYVIREIESLISRYNVRHIQFVDDTFTVSQQRAKEICEEIIRRNIKFDWHCFARIETVSEDLLFLMKEAGCTSILFGIESGDEAVLKTIKKGISLEKAKEVHDTCRKIGIKVLSSFIIGHPTETFPTANKTINFALYLKPTFALFYRLVPYPGSEVYEKYSSENRLKRNLGWDSFAPKGEETVFNHENLSDRELDLLIVKAYRKFYLNLSNLLRITGSLRRFGQFKALTIGLSSLIRQILKWKKKTVPKS